MNWFYILLAIFSLFFIFSFFSSGNTSSSYLCSEDDGCDDFSYDASEDSTYDYGSDDE